jgi:phenylacetate-CoA ligase
MNSRPEEDGSYPGAAQWPSLGRRLSSTAFLAWQALRQPRFPFRPREAVLRDQAGRVRVMVDHAYRRVPYYRETMDRLGLRPSDFQTADDLARLPILERHRIQEAPELFIAAGTRLKDCACLATSGSSGRPIRVYHDRRSALLTAAHGERYRSILAGAVGRRSGYRETLIMARGGANDRHRRFWLGSTFLFRRLIPRKQYLSVFDPLDRNIRLIADYDPDLLHCFGSYLEVLLARAAALGVRFRRLAAVAYGADAMSEQGRRLIVEKFGIPVFSSYNSVEALRLGFECDRHAGLHQNEDLYPLRIVDSEGRTLPPGERGEVIVSNLVNRATVVLNYRLGDMACFLPKPCTCGRSLPLLSFPEGRRDDWIKLPGGGLLFGHRLGSLMRSEESILQYQFLQVSLSRFRVSFVTRDGLRSPEVEQGVRAKLQSVLGPEAEVEVIFTSSLPRTRGGKLRPVVSLVEGGVPGWPGEAR